MLSVKLGMNLKKKKITDYIRMFIYSYIHCSIEY